MDHSLLEILACPQCKGPVEYKADQQEIVCRAERLAFPVRDGVPVMLIDQARHMDEHELAPK